MMKKIFLCVIAFFSMIIALGQSEYQIRLWADGEISDDDYKDAVLHCYLTDKPTGKAIIAFPGGGYEYVCMSYEGWDFAPFFNKEGISLFVLNYRLPKGRHTVPLADAEKAMRIVRSHAAEWGISELGIMGSSAGGHLATTLATHYSDSITRPDFHILLYPVVSMEKMVTHLGSRNALLGENPDQELVHSLSNEYHVTKDTPRAFIILSAGDKGVNPRNSLNYAQALVDNDVKVDLHMYEGGYHGFGSRESYSEYGQWTGELLYWLNKKK